MNENKNPIENNGLNNTPPPANTKENKTKKFLLLTILILFVFAIGLLATLAIISANKKSEQVSSSLSISSVSSKPIEKAEERTIDFATLTSKNADVAAWVEVPNTSIDYPVLTTTDNAFYLNHNEEKTYSPAGSVFMDMSNNADFTSPITVLYGHTMPDGTYFTQLHKYSDPEYFAKNREVIVYLPQKTNHYEIVAAYVNDDNNILYEKDYSDPETMEAFLESVRNIHSLSANIDLTGVTAKDQLVVLSTCTANGTERFLIIAKLIK